MAGRIQLRRGTAAQWAATNPVLASGEKGVEIDTGREKNGDGTRTWNVLPYVDAAAAEGLAAHLADTTDAHDASAISLAPIAGLGNPTQLQEAMASLPSRFLPQGPLDGRRWIIVGDSNSAMGTATIGGKSWTTFAPRMSGGKLYEAWDNGFYETNLATSGHTSTQQLATLNAFLTANPGYLPTLVSVMVGTNDVRDSSDPATWQANLAAYVTAVRAVSPSCQFVFHTLPPRSGPTSAVAPAIIEDVWNAWLRTWVAANGHTLVDVWRLVTDPATREFRSGVFDTSDGVHINAAGQYLIGQEYQRVVTPRLSTPPLTGDPRNLVPMSLTDPHNFEPPGIFTWAQDPPTGWVKTNPAGTTWLPVADPATPGGFAIELTSNDPTGNVRFTGTIARGTNWVDGDRLLVSSLIRVVSATNVVPDSAGFRMALIEAGASPVSFTVGIPFGQSLPTAEYQRCQFEWQPRNGNTSLDLRFEYIKGASVGGVIVARIGAVGVYNLTRLGIPR
jgi:lysophospholipase L1-like esterase